jgi:DNA-binding MarR family transcriptional regulator
VEQHAAPDLWSEFALAVFAVNGLIIRAGETISRPLGQSSARWQVLGRVYRPQTVPDIARDIGLARQSVQRTTDLLAAEGLVRFRAHPSDRRTQLVELTPDGVGVMSQIYRAQVQWSEQILKRLDPGMLRDLSRSLTEIADVLRRDLEIHLDDSHRKKEN